MLDTFDTFDNLDFRITRAKQARYIHIHRVMEMLSSGHMRTTKVQIRVHSVKSGRGSGRAFHVRSQNNWVL